MTGTPLNPRLVSFCCAPPLKARLVQREGGLGDLRRDEVRSTGGARGHLKGVRWEVVLGVEVMVAMERGAPCWGQDTSGRADDREARP